MMEHTPAGFVLDFTTRINEAKPYCVGGLWSSIVRGHREWLIDRGLSEAAADLEIGFLYAVVWVSCPVMAERMPRPAFLRNLDIGSRP